MYVRLVVVPTIEVSVTVPLSPLLVPPVNVSVLGIDVEYTVIGVVVGIDGNA